MLDHRKLGKWLPPGGKIDPNEIPDEAAIRETFEETGIHIQLIGEQTPVLGGLMKPYGTQLNVIKKGELEHIDFIYLAVPTGSAKLNVSEREAAGLEWVPVGKVLDPGFNTFTTVRQWVKILKPEVTRYAR